MAQFSFGNLGWGRGSAPSWMREYANVDFVGGGPTDESELDISGGTPSDGETVEIAFNGGWV